MIVAVITTITVCTAGGAGGCTTGGCAVGWGGAGGALVLITSGGRGVRVIVGGMIVAVGLSVGVIVFVRLPSAVDVRRRKGKGVSVAVWKSHQARGGAPVGLVIGVGVCVS